jgi:phosphoserine aminotransferase
VLDGLFLCCRLLRSSVGGMRVSLYNAISIEETEALARLMKEFEADHWKSVESVGAAAAPKS